MAGGRRNAADQIANLEAELARANRDLTLSNEALALSNATKANLEASLALSNETIAKGSACLLVIQDHANHARIIANADIIHSRVIGDPMGHPMINPTHCYGVRVPFDGLTDMKKNGIDQALNVLLPAHISRGVIPYLASTLIVSSSNIQVSDVDAFEGTAQLSEV